MRAWRFDSKLLRRRPKGCQKSVKRPSEYVSFEVVSGTC